MYAHFGAAEKINGIANKTYIHTYLWGGHFEFDYVNFNTSVTLAFRHKVCILNLVDLCQTVWVFIANYGGGHFEFDFVNFNTSVTLAFGHKVCMLNLVDLCQTVWVFIAK